MGWIPHSSTSYQMRVGSCGYVPLCQTPKAAASRAQERAILIRCGQPPGMLDQGPWSRPRVDESGGRGRQVAKSRLTVLIVGWRSDGMDHSQD
jgi:hypothetical protein